MGGFRSALPVAAPGECLRNEGRALAGRLVNCCFWTGRTALQCPWLEVSVGWNAPAP